jgi:hypothetical protein
MNKLQGKNKKSSRKNAGKKTIRVITFTDVMVREEIKKRGPCKKKEIPLSAFDFSHNIFLREKIIETQMDGINFSGNIFLPKKFGKKADDDLKFYWNIFVFATTLLKKKLRKKSPDKKITHEKRNNQEIFFSLTCYREEKKFVVLKIHNEQIAKELNMPLFLGFCDNNCFKVWEQILERLNQYDNNCFKVWEQILERLNQ